MKLCDHLPHTPDDRHLASDILQLHLAAAPLSIDKADALE